MNLESLVQIGSNPWLPNDQATDLDVWHFDDVPLVGVFSIEDDHVLFMAVGDVECPLTVWAYRPLTPFGLETLKMKEWASTQAFYDDIENQFAKECIGVATALRFVVDRWTPLYEPMEDVYAACTVILRRLEGLRDEPALGATVQDHFETFLEVREAAASASH